MIPVTAPTVSQYNYFHHEDQAPAEKENLWASPDSQSETLTNMVMTPADMEAVICDLSHLGKQIFAVAQGNSCLRG